MLLPKANYIRDEAWRRIVASMPCYLCGIQGYSQAAHMGKGGRAIKGNDSECLPLCASRPAELGCHAKVDQHIVKVDRHALAAIGRKAYNLYKEGLIDLAKRYLRP